MKIAIMQPYFLAYIGYFQLIKAVDKFVIYDNVQYHKGWINRNRILLNGNDFLFSIPLKKDSQFKNICDRYLADEFDRNKLLNHFLYAYRKAPYFEKTIEVLKEIIYFEKVNLVDYIHHSITSICTHIGFKPNIVRASSIDIDPSLTSVDRMIAICRAFDTKTYVNAIGGIKLYSKEIFAEKGIELKFIKSAPIEYQQFGKEFVAWLSIVDILMFNSLENVRQFLDCYELV